MYSYLIHVLDSICHSNNILFALRIHLIHLSYRLAAAINVPFVLVIFSS